MSKKLIELMVNAVHIIPNVPSRSRFFGWVPNPDKPGELMWVDTKGDVVKDDKEKGSDEHSR